MSRFLTHPESVPTVARHLLSGAVLAGALFASASARAQTIRYELDSAAPLQADGWNFISDGATASYDATGLTLQSMQGYAEWMLRDENNPPPPTTGWLGTVLPGRGFWVEARLRVNDATECLGSGPGLWIDDGKTFIRVLFESSAVHFLTNASADVAMNTSDAFHVYRVNSLGGSHFQLQVDGNVALDEPAVEATENGKALMFGDLGGCTSAQATWDYFAYDTFGPGAEPGDSDHDGIADAMDNCVLTPNPDQADADKDGIGDACDPCPHDPMNDADGDGLCADQDPCPTDPRNDQDHDGVCDTQECAPFVAGVPQTQMCPAICTCPPTWVGVDPIGGFGGGLDNFGGFANGGMGEGFNGGTGGKGASSSGGSGMKAGAGGAQSGGGGGSGDGGGSTGGTGEAGGSTGGGEHGGFGAGGGSAGSEAQAGRAGSATVSGAGSGEANSTETEHSGCGCRLPHKGGASDGSYAVGLALLLFVRRWRKQPECRTKSNATRCEQHPQRPSLSLR
jgi:hypothetical protein